MVDSCFIGYIIGRNEAIKHPRILEQPKDAAGGSVKFTVKVLCVNPAYDWEYSSDGGTTWQATSLTGHTTHTLSVTASASRDGFKYRCKITDAYGTTVVSDAATLTYTG